jgi:ankyrin repeat protein
MPETNALPLLSKFCFSYTISMSIPPMPPKDVQLFAAIKAKDLAATMAAVALGADLHSQNIDISPLSPLEVAARSGSPSVFAFLLSAGSTVRDPHFALCYAIDGGSLSILRQTTDVLPKKYYVGIEDTYTPLMHAIASDNPDMCRLLLQSGANPNIRAPQGISALAYALYKKSTRPPQSTLEIVRLLLENGASINSSFSGPQAPVLIAAIHMCLGGQELINAGLGVKLCELLIKHGADVNSFDEYGSTLHRAIVGASFPAGGLIFDQALISFLIKSGANVNASSKDGTTPLHRSVMTGNLEACRQLLTLGANVLCVDAKGRSPLHWCYGSNFNHDLALLLIHSGADVNAKDDNSATPMHKAAETGSVAACIAPLAHRADASAVDEDGRSALFFAINAKVARLLLDAGIDPEATDNADQTVESYGAIGMTSHEVYVFLKSVRHEAELDGSVAHAASPKKQRI